MDGIQYAVVTEKSLRLLQNNQYTSHVESGSTRTEIKHWVELFFGVKVIAMNSHRLPRSERVIDSPERVEEWDLLWDIQCIPITDV
jgi:large subunit ribosomal protein L23